MKKLLFWLAALTFIARGVEVRHASEVPWNVPESVKIPAVPLRTKLPAPAEAQLALELQAQPFPATAAADPPPGTDAGWQAVKLPRNWYLLADTRKPAEPYARGWYKIQLPLAAPAPGKRYRIEFEEIGSTVEAELNGVALGAHAGNFTPAQFDLTPGVRNGDNVLLLRVTSDLERFGTPPVPSRHAAGCCWGVEDIKGGVWGEIHLMQVPEIFIAESLITPQWAERAVTVETAIWNHSGKVRTMTLLGQFRSASLQDPAELALHRQQRQVVLQPGENKFTSRYSATELAEWSLENPRLYFLEELLIAENQVCDRALNRFGMRDFQIIGNRFTLNGEPIYLFGNNLMAVEYGGNGRDERARLRAEITRMKREGAVMLRTPHQPVIPAALEIADEEGILIFDEWAWAFLAGGWDQEAFRRNNLREVAEWVRRDHNHPSVVMWSCANEVVVNADPVYTVALLNALYEQIKSVDGARRPVSAMDGLDDYFGAPGVKTDLYSMHQYNGLSQTPWSMTRQTTYAQKAKSEQVFGVAIDKPVIFWECVGFSWNQPSVDRHRQDQPLSVEAYLRLARAPFSWGAPGPASGIAVCGMQAWLNPEQSMTFARNSIGKKVLEAFRLMPEYCQGFGPWFMSIPVENAPIWYAPIQALLDEGRWNLFAGESITGVLHLLNDSAKPSGPIQVEVRLVKLPPNDAPLETAVFSEVGEVVQTQKLDFAGLSAGTREKRKFVWPTRADLPEGFYQLQFLLNTPERQARNFYLIFLGDRKRLAAFAPPLRKLGITPGGSETFAQLLKQWQIPFSQVTHAEELDEFAALIVPPDGVESLLGNPAFPEQQLREWLKKGGRMAVLEQSKSLPMPFFGSGMLYGGNPNALIDLVRPGHPVFAALKQQNFDGWDGGESRLIVRQSLPVFDSGLVAASGPRYEGNALRSAAAEYKWGSGGVFFSQLEAVCRAGEDAVATFYLYSLLDYLLRQEQIDGLPELPEATPSRDWRSSEVNKIDLTASINRAFDDEVPEDGRGGWLDCGKQDLRTLPAGEQVFAQTPFAVNPAGAVITGSAQRDWPLAATIPIGRKLDSVAFLHAAAWSDTGNEPLLGAYLLRYADGEELRLPLVRGDNIGDWWNPREITSGALAWRAPGRSVGGAANDEWTLSGETGLYVWWWDNPRPEVAIESIQLASNGQAALILVGIAALEAGASVEVRPGLHAIEHPAGDGALVPQALWQEKLFYGSPGVRCLHPGNQPGRAGLLFLQFGAATAELNAMKPREFTGWVRNLSDGVLTLNIDLPNPDWSRTISNQAVLLPGPEWRKFTVPIPADFTMRGEAVISHASGTQAVTYEIAGLRFGK